MKKILIMIGLLALVQSPFALANTGVGESSTTPCTAINGSTAPTDATPPAPAGTGSAPAAGTVQ